MVLNATSMFQSGVYAYTVRYDVPASWVGEIMGACPEWAPMFISYGYYTPEWVAAGVLPYMGHHTLGSQLAVGRSQYELEQEVIIAQNQGWPFSPADPFTLCVTQVCGSIVALTPTG